MNDEKNLIQNCKNGDVNSFEKLIESHQKKVYNIAYRMMGNNEDALDAAQEALIKVYKSLGTFREESSFSTWVYRITANVCLDQLRKRNRINTVSMQNTVVLDDGEVEVQIEDNNFNPDVILEKNELRRSIVDAINHLNEDQRLVIILRDINGCSYEEIASILKCSLGTVKSRISRARNALKDLLTNEREQLSQNIV